MTFKAITKDISLMRDSLSTIADIIDEAQFKITKNGIEMLASDRAVVAVVDLSIPSSLFNKYEIDKDETIGMNLQQFMDILKRVDKGDTVELSLENKKFQIKIKANSTRRFVIPLLDLSTEEMPPVDKLAFTANIKLTTEVFDSGIEDAGLVADSVVFDVKPELVVMKTEADNRVAEMALDQSSKHLIKLDVTENSKARYSLEYLKKMIKAKKIANNVTLSFSNDYPMKISYQVPKGIKLDFVLAPRVDD